MSIQIIKNTLDLLLNEIGACELNTKLNELKDILENAYKKTSDEDAIVQESLTSDTVSTNLTLITSYTSIAKKLTALQSFVDLLIGVNYNDIVRDSITKADVVRKMTSKLLLSLNNAVESLHEITETYKEKTQPCKTIEEFIEIRKVFYKNIETIDVYVSITQKTIDNLYHNARGKMFEIVRMIEEDKEYILPDVENVYTASVCKNQPAIKRFGLMPICSIDTLDNILELILPNVSGKVDMQRYANKHDVGFIIMINAVYTPIEYNSRMLYDKEEFKNIHLPDGVGVNAKVLNLFGTIHSLLQDKKTTRQKWDMSIEIINKEAKQFYILEALESNPKNQRFRALAPWIQSSNALVSRHRIESLLSYIDKPHEVDRITKYQKLCIGKGLNFMFEHIPLDIESMIDRSKTVDIHIVRNKIYIELRKVIHKIIEKNKPKVDADVNEIIHDKRISIEMRRALIELKKMAGHVEHGFTEGELLTSYVVDTNYAVRRVMKELHDGYNRNPLKNITVDSLQQNLDELLMNIVNRVFGENDNIFSSIQLKQILLTYGQD